MSRPQHSRPAREPYSGRTLLVVGASARAAAQSALRAGFAPVAVDLFGDCDLCRIAPVLTVRRWPRDLPAICRTALAGPWMYGGALENHPRIVAAVSADRPLWGNPPPVLRQVRDPVRLWTALRDAGLPVPNVRPASDPPPADGRWLLKPRRSAAGHGIRHWGPGVRMVAGAEALGRPGTSENTGAGFSSAHYFQQFMPGTPISAVFVGMPPGAVLLGITRQWSGLESLSAAPFAYCGSIGPLSLPGPTMQQIDDTAQLLVQRFGLRGLFGMDFILAEDGTAWPTEVNPRYTASVEVLEHALGIPAVALHARAFGASNAPQAATAECSLQRLGSDSTAVSPAPFTRTVAKAILYAPGELIVPALDCWRESDPPHMLPAYADVPHTGQPIPAGRPVCTVLAAGKSPVECVRQLDDRLASLRAALNLPANAPLSPEEVAPP